MTKKIIFTTDNAPAPIGPYNQAILIGNTLYTSGQIALNPKTMELVLDDIETETKQVMENLKAVLDCRRI
jgi:2-iminobutanoate/2-iminopropanoate deaminase